MRKAILPLAILLAGLASTALADSVRIENAWVRATAPGQKVAAGFMDLTADANMKLVGGSSTASASVELHTMDIDGGVMVMRQVREIALAKDKKVSLKPGGLHIMFIDLKQQIKDGDMVPVTLKVQDAAGKERPLQVEVKAMRGHGMSHHHH